MKHAELLSILKKVTPAKPISFVSTRDEKHVVPFWQSLIQGMADDGGLLIPERIPTLPASLLSDAKFWKSLAMSDISSILLRSFVSLHEVSDEELVAMLKSAHNFTIPLEKLDTGSTDNTLWIARLDQGPTASFKDIAARALGKLIDLYCEKNDRHINIIVATSGDTGVAVADAFGGSPYVNVTVLYPSGGVSEIQEKQMLSVHHRYANEQVIPVKGNFDVCQDLAKAIQQARTAKSAITDDVNALNVSSANSINIWRLLPQMTQYFSSYANLVAKGAIKAGQEIVFAVPTGNVGHLMAGMYAKELGLPIKLFIVGTNANNVLANIIGSGKLKHRGFMKTSSPSMDILDPSNLERLLAFVSRKSGTDGAPAGKIDLSQMKKDIKEISEHGIDLKRYGVTEEMLRALQALIWVEDIETDEEVYAMMRHIAEKAGIVLEPHGVTAFIATLRAQAKKAIAADDIVVIFETAHPDKFPESLAAAGIKGSKIKPHAILNAIKRTSFAKLKKPSAIAPDATLIVDRMKKLAKSQPKKPAKK